MSARPTTTVSLSEAAERLGVTPDNLRGAIRRGTLKASKHGGRDWWLEPAEVQRYQRDNLGQPGRKPDAKKKGKR